jgi:tetratricopeptide (TPR) repeat protein
MNDGFTEEEEQHFFELKRALHGKRKTGTLCFMQLKQLAQRPVIQARLEREIDWFQHLVFDVRDQQIDSLHFALRTQLDQAILQSQPMTYMVHVVGMENSNYVFEDGEVQETKLIENTNMERGTLWRFPFHIVIWTDPYFIQQLQTKAIDFWSWINYYYKFDRYDDDLRLENHPWFNFEFPLFKPVYVFDSDKTRFEKLLMLPRLVKTFINRDDAYHVFFYMTAALYLGRLKELRGCITVIKEQVKSDIWNHHALSLFDYVMGDLIEFDNENKLWEETLTPEDYKKQSTVISALIQIHSERRSKDLLLHLCESITKSFNKVWRVMTFDDSLRLPVLITRYQKSIIWSSEALNWQAFLRDRLNSSEIHPKKVTEYLQHSLKSEPFFQALYKAEVASIFTLQGKHKQALQLYSELAEHFEFEDNPRFQALSLANAAEIHCAKGDLDQAREVHTQALELFQSYGDEEFMPVSNFHLYKLETQAGNREKAIEHLVASYTLLEEIENHRGLSVVGEAYAEHLLQAGDKDRALEVLEQARIAYDNLTFYDRAAEIAAYAAKLRESQP